MGKAVLLQHIIILPPQDINIAALFLYELKYIHIGKYRYDMVINIGCVFTDRKKIGKLRETGNKNFLQILECYRTKNRRTYRDNDPLFCIILQSLIPFLLDFDPEKILRSCRV